MRWSARLSCLLLSSLASLAAAKDEPDIVTKTFDSDIENLLYFDDSNTIIFPDAKTRKVWQSGNGGISWDYIEDVEDAFEIVKHPYDSKVAVILGTENTHYITKDTGETWTSFKTEVPINIMGRALSFHAADSDRILFHGIDCESIFCSYPIYYTTDGFKSAPKLLHENVLSCLWAKTTEQFTTGDKDTDTNRILCNVEGEFSFFETDSRVVITDDYFKTKGIEPLLDGDRPVAGIINVASVTGYLAAAAKSAGSTELALYVTTDTTHWHQAEFGNHTIEQDAYTILESTNYSMQVDVLTTPEGEPSMGVLFTSDSNGTLFTQNIAHTNRHKSGYVDFEKVSGIPGIVIVNVIDNADEIEGDKHGIKKLVSRISFDDGRTWQPLKLKSGDDDLHLHSVTDQRNTGRVFSSPAPGILMGVGNAGSKLKGREAGNTYVSDDAGVTWTKAIDGPHMYEMGDSGSILVAVEDGHTDKISFSLDHGQKWQTSKLDHTVIPLALTTTPDSTSLKFILIAQEYKKNSNGGDFEIVALDFGGLHERACKSDDFEQWSARVDKDDKPACLMGATLKYKRRKSDVKCFIGDEFKDPEPHYEPCECTDADFECDYGFTKDSKGECIQAGRLRAPEGTCPGDDEDETYQGTSGYRKISGNICKGGVTKDKPVERKCEDTTSAPASGNITSTITTDVFKKAKKFMPHYYLERCEKCTGDDETVVVRTDEGVVYVTYDQGKKWEKLPGVKEKDEIKAIVPHHYFNDQVFFLTKDRVYFSRDRAKKVKSFKMPVPIDEHIAPLSFHPKQADWMLWTGTDDDETIAKISTKRGEDFETLLRGVRKCDFVYSDARPNSTNLIYCEQYVDEDPQNNLTLLSSDDFFKTNNELKSAVVNFATMSEYIVVAIKESSGDLRVDASIDGRTFADAHFPHGFEGAHQHSYTVLDSSTHSVFLHVTTYGERGYEYGTIVKSNSNGTEYVMAISDVNRNVAGYVDFEKIRGLEGASIVNIVANVDDVKKSEQKKFKTMATHNDGAEWAYIERPKDSDKFKTDWCNGQRDVCSLHLHGFTERRDRDRSFSSPTAVGLLIAHGNVGEYLTDLESADTFMSTDGGVTWTMIAEGQWLYAYGDRGSIVTIVRTDKPTDYVMYTLDEGENWNSYIFSENEMTVQDLTTVPSDTSRMIMLWGELDKGLATVNIDFSNMKERSKKCSMDEKNPESDKDDYYLWTPKHPLMQTDCLFGHKAKYHRKLPKANCYNGQSLPTLHDISETCECTRQDFECDYNFERQSDGSCLLVPGLEPANAQDVCFKNESIKEYYEITGYRRIPLTTCQGGKELDYTRTTHPCPDYVDDYNRKHGISGVGLFFAIVIPISAAAAAGWYVWRNWDGKFGRIQLGDGAAGSRIGLGGAFDSDAPWIRYPVLAVSALITVVVAIPMVVSTLYRTVRTRFDRRGGRYGGYNSRPYTSRGSFQRGRGNYSVVDPDEGELLGDDSEDEEA